MKTVEYPEAVQRLILHLKRLPGIGSKSAERMAVWILGPGREALPDFLQTLDDVASGIRACPDCGFFIAAEGCRICLDDERDSGLLCVVEQATGVLPIERTGIYSGHYHVLGGRLSPLDNVGPEDLRLGELEQRLDTGRFREVILALGSDVAGEATSNFVASLIRAWDIPVTQLAQGMPVGGALDTADSLTLHRAFQNRSGVLSL